MRNQFLFENAIALTIGTLFLTIIYTVVLVKVCNYLILKKQVSTYEDSDRIVISSIIFTFLLNLSSVVNPIYQTLQQFKYSYYKNEFTLQILTKASYFILIATLYSIIALVIVNIGNRLLNQKQEEHAEDSANFSQGIFYGLFLIGTALLFKEHLNTVLSAMIQTNSVPIFN